MKKILFFLLIIAVTMPACKKWLDVKSKTDVVETDMFSDEQGFMDAMAGVYYTMTDGNLYGNELTMGLMDVLAHRYDITGFTIFNYKYQNGYNEPGYYFTETIRPLIDAIWDKSYNAIANTNNIIINADVHRPVFKANNYNLVKGEALGLRAFLHFDLLRLFAPSYLTSPDSLSIPYVTLFTGKVITPLSTVKAITDSIIVDLNAAATLLTDDDIHSASAENSWLNNRKCHFNKWAVEATLARVYLYRGDKVNALIHANKIIASNSFRFITVPEISGSNNIDYSFTPEQIFSINKYGMEQQVTDFFQSPYGGYQLSNGFDNVQNIYEAQTVGSSDLRWVYMWRNYNDIFYPAKYWFSNAKEKNLIPLIRIPEMYYIAAECSAPATANDLLNTVRQNRGVMVLPEGMTTEELQNEIFKEYQKEFYAEGQLFYYYKRLNRPYIVDNDNMGQAIPDYIFPIPDNETQFEGR